MQESFSKTRSIVNRIGRFSPVVFIRRYIYVFIILFILILTNVFGLWNVRRVEFELPENSYTNINKLEESSNSVKGMNIFFVSVGEVSNILKDGNGFVKRITVEKKIPFTLHILVEEYEPTFIGYSSSRCVLFSEEGGRIEELCTDCSEECSTYLDVYPAIHVTSTAALESDNRLIFREEIADILDILSVFGFNIKSISIEDGISTLTSLDDHIFVFDLSDDLSTQLNRMYIVGKKINSDSMEFKSLDLRFERPVMRLE
jgi:hypothetical protein